MGDIYKIINPNYDPIVDDIEHDGDVSGNDDVDTPEKCKERRQRRIERRRRMLNGGGSGGSSSSTPSSGEEQVVVAPPVAVVYAVEKVPEYGVMSVSGRMREMEDAVKVCMELCRPEIEGCLPVHLFAVYDGHGGSHVSKLCREKLHVLLQEELLHLSPQTTPQAQAQAQAQVQAQQFGATREDTQNGLPPTENGWRVALKRTFERMDEVALITCACGATGFNCNCGHHPVAVALAGSTATVAVVTPHHVVVANCGDSRAVMSRGGRVLPLSVDQKPDRPDERARIEAAGGRVLFLDGPRVQGILAMSRAIGDKFLKPFVISEPEITIIRRDPEDECLILASDGMWDVISNELACKVACECLREGSRILPPADFTTMGQNDDGSTPKYPSQSSLAAALLTRLALGRESSDNISVIVVDLKNR